MHFTAEDVYKLCGKSICFGVFTSLKTGKTAQSFIFKEDDISTEVHEKLAEYSNIEFGTLVFNEIEYFIVYVL